MQDTGHGDTIKKIRTSEELHKLHLEDRNSQTRLDLSEFDFRNEQYLDNLLTCYGQYGKNYTLKEVYLSDTILKVKVEIVEYEKAGWSDAHTPSQEWAYARECRQEKTFESLDDYDRKDYLGLGYEAKLIIVPHGGRGRSEEKRPQQEKPKLTEPVKAPEKPTPAPAPKPDEPAEKPNPPQPIPQHVLDSMEENRRKKQKKINFWSWMIFVVVIIAAVLITMRT